MEEAGDLEISGCGSTTTTTTVDDDIGCYWDDWSPVADLGTFCANDHNFRSLMESMMSDGMDCEDGVGAFTDVTRAPSVDTTTNTGTWRPADEPSNDEKGLRLVHLLMGAAEALTGPHQSRELARVILVRLKELVSTAGGTNMERLAAHFADALQALLDGSHPAVGTRTAHRDSNHNHYNPADVMTAFQLLQDMSPYVKFGHFTANQAILEAMSGERRVHIIDFDIAEGVQWASLMQAMVSRPDGPPPPHLRITAVARGGGGGSRVVQETGRRLATFAASLGQPFSFGQCRLDADEHFRPAGVRVVKGEVVAANCVLHQAATTTAGASKQSARSVLSFLLGAAELGARVVTMVEEETGEDQDEGGGFVERFMEELHRYSALWDSLEAGFPTQCGCRVRGLVERVILGPKIAGAVGRAFRGGGGGGGGGEGAKGGWAEWMRGMGFKGVDISCFNHCQARLLLGLFNDGYRVEEGGPNKLVLGWKSRRLLSASVWSPPPSPSLPASPASVLPTAGGFVAGLGLEDYDSFLVDEPFGLV